MLMTIALDRGKQPGGARHRRIGRARGLARWHKRRAEGKSDWLRVLPVLGGPLWVRRGLRCHRIHTFFTLWKLTNELYAKGCVGIKLTVCVSVSNADMTEAWCAQGLTVGDHLFTNTTSRFRHIKLSSLEHFASLKTNQEITLHCNINRFPIVEIKGAILNIS